MDNETEICPDCGSREALEAFGMKHDEIEEMIAEMNEDRKLRKLLRKLPTVPSPELNERVYDGGVKSAPVTVSISLAGVNVEKLTNYISSHHDTIIDKLDVEPEVVTVADTLQFPWFTHVTYPGEIQEGTREEFSNFVQELIELAGAGM